jgi:hypothetical protein
VFLHTGVEESVKCQFQWRVSMDQAPEQVTALAGTVESMSLSINALQ